MPDTRTTTELAEAVKGGICNDNWGNACNDAAEALSVLQARADRLLTLALGLFVMVPDQVWKDSLGDDGQGHYEGLYRAEQIQKELKSYGG